MHRSRGGGWRQGLVAAHASALLLLPATALAGNTDPYYHSGDAALQAGAITADSRDGGAAWYNPAGLANLPEFRFDVSVSAFSLSFGGRPDLAATADSKTLRLTKPDLSIVPSAMTVTHHFGPVGVAFGVFAPQQRVSLIRTQVTNTAANPEATGISIGLDANLNVKEYAIGPSIGFRLHPRVDLGFSLFANYRNEVSIIGLDASGQSGSRLTSHQTSDLKQFGLQPLLGVQLHPGHNYELGFAVRLPSFELFEQRQTVDVSTTASNATIPEHTSQFAGSSKLGTATATPMRFHAGVSRRLGNSRLALEVNYQTPFRNSDSDWKAVVNLRLGGKHQLSQRYTIGGGLFSDRSPERGARSFGDVDLDYYGVTIAVDRGSLYAIAAENGRPVKHAREIRFGTTVALTYAIGLGKVVGVDSSLREVPSSAVAHDLILHVSSSLME